jgi:hypothetical protein
MCFMEWREKEFYSYVRKSVPCMELDIIERHVHPDIPDPERPVESTYGLWAAVCRLKFRGLLLFHFTFTVLPGAINFT